MRISKLYLEDIYYICIMIFLRKISLFYIVLFSFQYTLGSNIDSLSQISKNGSVDERIKAYLNLDIFYRNSNPDTSLYFLYEAKKILNQASAKNLSWQIYDNIGINHKLRGDFEEAKLFFDTAMTIAVELKDTDGIAMTYNNVGTMYDDKGELENAIKSFLKALPLFLALSDSDGIALSYNNLGLIYYKLERYDQAMRFYRKSLVLRKKQNDLDKIALLYNNIGILYYFKDNADTCLSYFKKAANIWEQANNIRQTALVLSNIGELYSGLGMYPSAKNYQEEALKKYQQLKDLSGELTSLSALAVLYHRMNMLKQAENYFKDAIRIAKDIQSMRVLKDNYLALSQLYQDKKDFSEALKTYILYTNIKDSLFNIEKITAIEKLQTQYETKEKEKQIALLNNENLLSIQKTENFKRLVIFLIIGFLLIAIVVILVIRQNLIRKKVNYGLQLKNNEIILQNEEIISQRDEIEAQRDLVEQQKNQLSKVFKEVSQSIDYAKRIQDTTLPDPQYLKNNFSDYFIYFNPRDIVSGDFYWWAEVEEEIVIAVADCTGHGVPGAIMSMLGMSLLKEIVVKEYITHPGVILRKLRKEVINTLQQKGKIGEQKDGMDISLISINKKTKVLKYAGANNPLYLITNTLLENKNDKIIRLDISTEDKFFYEIKADKMPIAIYEKMNKFTTHEIILKKDDILYLFSDGFPDQFGGANDKKFKHKPFKRLLFKNAHLAMSQQQEIINTTFKSWKGESEQVDDVVVMGIKI